jgi:hypothetical protein
MGGLISGAISGIGGLILSKIEHGEIQNWIRLLLSVFFSAFIGFFGPCGFLLIAGKPWAIAIGWGMVWMTVCVFSLLLRDPRGRTLMLVVPQSITKAYQQGIDGTGTTVIEPSKK